MTRWKNGVQVEMSDYIKRENAILKHSQLKDICRSITTAQAVVQEWMEVSRMYSFTQSAAKFFFDKYPQEASLFMFGHTEAITEEMCKEYIEWCRTDEGRSYLKGGANYIEDGGDD